MEFETNFYDTEISLYFSRFSSLPQAVSARLFFFSKDDERLKGIMRFIPIWFLILHNVFCGVSFV